VQIDAVKPNIEVISIGVRTYGQMGSVTPPGKMDEKLKSMQKEQFSMFMLHFESNQGRQV